MLDLARLLADAEGYVLKAVETYDQPTKPLHDDGQVEPCAQFGYAAHMVVVDVGTRLGRVKPQRFVAAHEVGPAINQLLIEGQVHGGFVQEMGMALREVYIPGRNAPLSASMVSRLGM